MAKQQKPNTKDQLILILLGIAAILVFWVYHVVANYSFEKATAINTCFDPSIATTEYQNTDLNYSLSYPTGWIIEEKKNTEQEVIIKKNENNNETKIDIKIYPQNNLSLLQWFDKKISDNGKISMLDNNPITIANIPSLYLRTKENETFQTMSAYVPYNNFVYEIKLTYPSDSSNVSFYYRAFKELSSSFSFQQQ